MRGKLLHTVLKQVLDRIIPAHAGQTTPSSIPLCHCSDHPRACGANDDGIAATFYGDGSSPRMRGKLAGLFNDLSHRRIIPAHAGQTHHVQLVQRPESDHPRACGANSASRLANSAAIGSSPRMRGKRTSHERINEPRRIIPAHAGQTEQEPCGTRGAADHPRACGANSRLVRCNGPEIGSSPRMRGKRMAVLLTSRYTRIIPAHAGQTCCRSIACRRRTDHPRACGANPRHDQPRAGTPGSSPRMRGKPASTDMSFGIVRIIPAHAGQT